MEYPLVDLNNVENTKDRIRLSAVMMFAQNGYAAVSIRDIAKSVNITPASIYNHFESKEALFDDILDTIETVYLEYFGRLHKRVEKATCFAQVMDCLFAELKDVYHMFIYYGISLLAAEQMRNEKARGIFYEVYIKNGAMHTAAVLDGCIEKNWVKAFDTEAFSVLLMNNVFAGSLLRAQEDMGYHGGYDATRLFTILQSFLLSTVEVLV